MQRNYLIVVYNKILDEFGYSYYETLEDLQERKRQLKNNKYITIKHIYKITELNEDKEE